MRRALFGAALAAAVLACGCGGPDRLGREDVRTLTDAQSRIGDALELEETIRTDPKAAKRLRARVQKVVSSGSFEGATTDEFGIAMLGELRRSIPSLVLEKPSGDVLELDKPATRAFLADAERDPEGALAIPVRRQVKRIDDAVDDSDAKADTEVPPLDPSASGNETVDSYLRGVEGDLRPRYPREAARIAALRGDL